jgi:hypothetical protein
MEVDVTEGRMKDGSAEIKLGFHQSSCLPCATEILVHWQLIAQHDFDHHIYIATGWCTKLTLRI